MQIYIAASWKHQHGVEMLTSLLRECGYIVHSWVENCSLEAKPMENFDEWCWGVDGGKCFEFDTKSAMGSDLVIYLGPSGKDAAAELGMAYAKGIPILGLHAKGEDFGLMRRMIKWERNYVELLNSVEQYALGRK